MLLASAQLVYAESTENMRVLSTNIVTNDIDATFIEGHVAVANGQTITVRSGLRDVAEKVMPNTGASAAFRIKVPGRNISTRKMTVFTVRELAPETGKLVSRERVEVNYVERQKQEINLVKDEYQLTFPGNDEQIEANTTSGENLIYTSSDPDVAVVDENGRIITTGEGKAVITAKQIGNGKYEQAEKNFKVSVKAIDAYTITFHSSADGSDETIKQVIPVGADGNLTENPFQNGSHEFFGWAKTDDGLVEYTDAAAVKDMAGAGDNVDLYAVWSGDGARAAVAWAIKIANDDSFSYGKKPQTSRIGCYFCGTSQKRKPKGYEKTYVCLTFAAAAFAHGAEDPEIYYACSHAKMPMYENDKNFSQFSCWKKIGRCSSLSIDDLEPGDVVIQWSKGSDNSGHVWIYAGNNNVVDSEGIKDCWGPKSIALREGKAAAKLRSTARANSKSYVMRYVGPNA